MRRILILLISILLLLASALAWLSLTESGLAFVVSQAERFVPELSIQKTSGRFYYGAQFEEIVYQVDDQSSLAINNLEISWQAIQLVSGRVVIDKLHVGDVVMMQNAEQTTESSPISLPNINIPLVISLKNLSVNSLTLIDTMQNKTQLISGLTLELRLWGDSLNIKSLSIDYADNVNLMFNGSLTLSGHYATDLNYQWTIIDPKLKSIHAEGSVQGNVSELILSQQLLTPIRSTQEITLIDVIDKLKWTADIQIPHLKLADFVDEQAGLIEQLSVRAKGDLTQADIVVDSQFKQTGFPELSVHSQTSSQNATTDFANWKTDTTLKTAEGMTLRVNGQINQILTSPDLALKAHWQDLAWPLIEPNKRVTSDQGELVISGNIDSYALAMAGEVASENQVFSLLAEAQGNAEKIAFKQFQIRGLQGEANIGGWLNWQSEPSYELALNWQDIVIPEALSPFKLATKQGELKLAGSTTLSTVTSAIELSVNAIPATINMNGQATDKGFEQLTISTKTDSGHIDFNGQLFWLDTFKLNGMVKLANFNPQLVAPEWAGDLSGGWTMSVDNLKGNTADVRIDALDVKGLLRKKALHLRGNLSYLQQQLTISNLQLVSGQSAISINGHVKDVADLKWTLNSPDLADFYPDLGGQLNAQGTVTEMLATPLINASLSGQNIVYSDLVSIKKIKTDLSLDMASQGKLEAKVSLSDARLDTLKDIDSVLSLSGSKESHHLSFELHNKNVKASGQLSGALTTQGWQGQFANLKLDQTQVGLWDSTEHGLITIASNHAVIEQHCLHSLNGELCLQGQTSPKGDWQGSGKFNNVSMSVLHAFSSALEPIEGQLNGHFVIAGKGQYPIEGQGDITLDKAKLVLTTFDQKEQKAIPLQTVQLDYQLTDKNTTAKLLIVPDLKGVSALTGEVMLPTFKMVIDDLENAELRGAFKTKIEDLSVFDALNAEYENLKGYLNVDLSLAGTVKKPAVTGQIVMDKASVELPSLGLLLSGINATAKGSIDQGIQFSYQAKSGKGHLTGEGKFITNDSHWQLDTSIKGHEIELINLPEAYVIASHDLKISVSDKTTHITGSVIVPEAELAPLQFNMPVSPSKDVVILSNQPEFKENPLPTILDVKVTLGDKVNISAVGFNGRLTGNLLVTGDANKILLGTGAIVIKDGRYTAYGQKLAVDDGQILFSGGALDNPQLNIKAIRKGETFTAGLHVEGAADNPQITLFSTPSMSQDNVLAHIILGRPIGDASVADAGILASAATGLGIKGGNQMGDRIASTFGLDSVEIAGDGGEDTALQIGKYLSPKLYLGYGIGIFEPVSTVIMRYKLSKIWSLKAESGVETSVDFLYTHER